MAITKTHELHKRRFGRNAGVGLALLGFVVLVFLLTMAKVKRGESIEAYDFEPRISLTPATGPTE
jgi:hypothetical protein